MRQRIIRAALLVVGLLVLAWLVFGSPSLVGAVLGALSVGVLAFVLAELTGQWPVRR